MHYDFFLSHCREDKTTAAFPLYNALQHMGFSVWIDRKEIVTGDLIFRNIEAAIQNSTCVIALIAPLYLDRTWTKRELQLTLELEQATHSNKKLFPIYHHTWWKHKQIKIQEAFYNEGKANPLCERCVGNPAHQLYGGHGTGCVRRTHD